MEYRLRYRCGPVAKRFHHDRASRVKLLIGPFGTGKTSSAAWDLIEEQAKRVLPSRGKVRRSRFAVVRNTYPELRDTTIRTYLDWFPPEVFGQYNKTAKSYLLRYEDREVELLFKALDTPKDVRDLLSLDLTGAHVDEVREVNYTIFKGLLGRVGRFPSLKDTGGKNPFLTPPQVDLTTNYPDLEHWLYGNFVSCRVEGYQIYEQSQEENKHNLRPGYYEDLAKDYADRPDLLRTLVQGKWGITVKGRAVYPEFDSRRHVSERKLEPVDGVAVRCWDTTGLSPACLVTQLNAVGQWLLEREFCGEDDGISEFGERVTAWSAATFGSEQKYRDIADPAGETRGANKRSPHDYLRALQIKIELGIQTWKVRREAVAGRLRKSINRGEPSVLIDPGCLRLVGGFEGGFAYPERGNTGEFADEPAKNKYSHIHDACQYGATRLFPAVERVSSPAPKSELGRDAGPGGWMG